jgi:single-stranded DNA-binding protein
VTAAPGIEVALTGRLGRPPEPRTTKAGNPMLILNLAVDEGDDAPATWVRALIFGDDGEACRDLEPGAKVYVEGRLKAEAYTPRDGGEPRVSLAVLCRVAQPMGRIGRKRPARSPRTGNQPPGAPQHRPPPERAPVSRKPALATAGGDADEPPFDDEIPFG